MYLDSVQLVRRYGLESLASWRFAQSTKQDPQELKALAVID